MINVNYHTHTKRCRHAAGEDREYVEAAIRAGLRVLGFSDHAPYVGFDGDYYSWYRMYPEDLEDYVESVNSLKREYKNDIEIHLGLEAEYYPRLFDKFLEFIRPYEIEYLIMGQHFSDTDQYGVYAPMITDPKLTEKYINQCIEGINTGLFSYIAHPDIFGVDRTSEDFARLSEKYCLAAKKVGVPLEINFLGLGTRRIYPCDDFFRIASKVGNDVIFGQDAHSPAAFFDLDMEMEADKMVEYFRLNRTENIDISRLSRFFSYEN